MAKQSNLPFLKRVDIEDEIIKIPIGATSFGRGPFLKCKEKKVSRNHGLLELTSEGQIFVTSIYISPVYLKRFDDENLIVLKLNQRERLRDGDEFRLLPDAYCFRLCLPEVGTSGADSEPVSAHADGGKDDAKNAGTSSAAYAWAAAGASATTDTSAAAGTSVAAGTSAAAVTSSTAGTSTAAATSPAAPLAATSALDTAGAKEVEVKSEVLTSSGSLGGTEDGNRTSSPSGPTQSAPASAARESAQTPLNRSASSSPQKQPDGRNRPADSSNSNGKENVTPVVNGAGAMRKRKLPAFLLNADFAAESAPGGGKQKRSPAKKAGTGSAPGGRQPKQRASPAASASPRGRKKQRPSEVAQMSQEDFDDIPAPVVTSSAAVASSSANVVKAPVSSAVAAAAETVAVATKRDAPQQPATGPAQSGSSPSASAVSAPSAAAGSSSTPKRPKAAVGSRRDGHDLSDSDGDSVGDGGGGAQAGTAGSTSSQRESCGFGAQCFRKNPAHRTELAHPGDADYVAPPDPDGARPLPECEFGLNCYRKNPQHRKMFRHTARPNPGREAKRAAQRKAQQQQGDTPDSYDLDDPFINDSESDDYAPDGSGSDWSAEEGSGSDEEDRRRMAREARRVTGKR